MEKLKSIIDVAARIGIPKKYLELYGEYKAKVSLDIFPRLKPPRQNGKYVLITGITPTPLGEGKTVTTIGLAMALNRLRHKAISCIREPSVGPYFGVKGAGTGGGRSQVLPAEDINLHLTGDIHAVGAAHNLCSAFLDNVLFRGNSLAIDTDKIFWKRVIDVNDRSVRSIRLAFGGGNFGVERTTSFDITAASELMAILALSTSLKDLRNRLGNIVLALDRYRKPVTAGDIKVAGAMAVLLKDAIKPNIVQTSEGTASFVHTGPFANITHGNSSIVADMIGLGLCDYVVTEAGFGADCGAEKFFDIKCRTGNLKPDAAVLVASVRGVKAHSGIFKPAPGRELDGNIRKENMDALEMGWPNLEKQIENVRIFGVPCVVAINRFELDSPREIAYIRRMALEAGAFSCVTSDIYKRGSSGGIELAQAVIDACRAGSRFNYLYPLDMPIAKKIETIAVKIYGAKSVRFDKRAEENIGIFERLGFGRLPICMAKTHLSLSHDPGLKGAPKDFILPVRDVRPSTGAGFLYALCGDIVTMPGLPTHPIGEFFDIDKKGRTIFNCKRMR